MDPGLPNPAIIERVTTIFVVQDEFHAEQMGRFADHGSAIAYLERLKAEPSAPENRPPCTSWRTCRRDYALLEYDDTTRPWTLLSSEAAFTVDRGQVRPVATRPDSPR